MSSGTLGLRDPLDPLSFRPIPTDVADYFLTVAHEQKHTARTTSLFLSRRASTWAEEEELVFIRVDFFRFISYGSRLQRKPLDIVPSCIYIIIRSIYWAGCRR